MIGFLLENSFRGRILYCVLYFLVICLDFFMLRVIVLRVKYLRLILLMVKVNF